MIRPRPPARNQPAQVRFSLRKATQPPVESTRPARLCQAVLRWPASTDYPPTVLDLLLRFRARVASVIGSELAAGLLDRHIPISGTVNTNVQYIIFFFVTSHYRY